MVVEFPCEMVTSFPASTVGSEFTVTVVWSVEVQPKELVTVTVYGVVAVGLAVGVAICELFKSVDVRDADVGRQRWQLSRINFNPVNFNVSSVTNILGEQTEE